MLTGKQIADARLLAGYSSQVKLAEQAGVSLPTLARAEQARDKLPNMSVASLARIVKVLEDSGIVFEAKPFASMLDGAEGKLLKQPRWP